MHSEIFLVIQKISNAKLANIFQRSNAKEGKTTLCQFRRNGKQVIGHHLCGGSFSCSSYFLLCTKTQSSTSTSTSSLSSSSSSAYQCCDHDHQHNHHHRQNYHNDHHHHLNSGSFSCCPSSFLCTSPTSVRRPVSEMGNIL